MKKTYIEPRLEVIQLKANQTLLVVSETGESTLGVTFTNNEYEGGDID